METFPDYIVRDIDGKVWTQAHAKEKCKSIGMNLFTPINLEEMNIMLDLGFTTGEIQKFHSVRLLKSAILFSLNVNIGKQWTGARIEYPLGTTASAIIILPDNSTLDLDGTGLQPPYFSHRHECVHTIITDAETAKFGDFPCGGEWQYSYSLYYACTRSCRFN